MTHSIHQKGFDSFTTTEYNEGVAWLRAALEGNGWTVDFQPSHIAARDFPSTAEALSDYACVMLSDIGANTLLLHPDTFTKSKVLPNRLHAVRGLSHDFDLRIRGQDRDQQSARGGAVLGNDDSDHGRTRFGSTYRRRASVSSIGFSVRPK